ncbi:hypothetical protein WJX81_000985 [Elliptochloris bilobata]|uniref:Inositol-tetrakisphosphate 1-kinase n=1 Tax=Elliptochloris bilobata TaxID=381761 RepID=A0AAW1QLA9_9CHLO
MAGPEEKAERYQKALVALVSEIQQTELTPLYKEGFLCAARCCDTQSPETMQACIDQCQGTADGARTFLDTAINDFHAKKHLRPKLLATAAAAGVTIKVVHYGQPLAEQGPFDVLLHKIRRKEWEEELADYQREHPGLRVVDTFDAIRPIMSRATMLAPLEPDGIELQEAKVSGERAADTVTVCAPQQVSIPEGCSTSEAQRVVAEAGMRPPFLAKPLWADGRDGAHGLAVIHDEAGLVQLVEGRGLRGFRLPVMLQQYVEHGGCLFKIFVMGPIVVLVRRPSLRIPVDPEDVTQEVGAVQTIARISSFASEMPSDVTLKGDPPQWVVQGLAQELRRRLGLDLFNFDLLHPSPKQPGRVPDRADYLVIDINYFPGYEKLPHYEDLMSQYLATLFPQAAPGGRALRTFVSFSQKPLGRVHSQ